MKNNEKNNLNEFIKENKKILKVTLIGFCFLGLVARATLQLPHIFSAGTEISASQVNDNFQAVVNSLTNTIVKTRPNTTKSITADDTSGSFDGTKSKTSNNSSVPLMFDHAVIAHTNIMTAGSASLYSVFKVPVSGWYKAYVKLDTIYIDPNLTANLNFNYSINKAASIDLNTGVPTGESQLEDDSCTYNNSTASGCGGIVTEKYLEADEFIYVAISYWTIYGGSGAPPADGFTITKNSEFIVKQVN